MSNATARLAETTAIDADGDLTQVLRLTIRHDSNDGHRRTFVVDLNTFDLGDLVNRRTIEAMNSDTGTTGNLEMVTTDHDGDTWVILRINRTRALWLTTTAFGALIATNADVNGELACR